MPTLFRELLSVVEELPGSIEDAVRSKYQEIVLASANKLDDVKSIAGDQSHPLQVVQATAALKALFRENAVIPESPTYNDVKQENW